jgi:hypothetical protein
MEQSTIYAILSAGIAEVSPEAKFTVEHGKDNYYVWYTNAVTRTTNKGNVESVVAWEVVPTWIRESFISLMVDHLKLLQVDCNNKIVTASSILVAIGKSGSRYDD